MQLLNSDKATVYYVRVPVAVALASTMTGAGSEHPLFYMPTSIQVGSVRFQIVLLCTQTPHRSTVADSSLLVQSSRETLLY